MVAAKVAVEARRERVLAEMARDLRDAGKASDLARGKPGRAARVARNVDPATFVTLASIQPAVRRLSKLSLL